MTGPGLWSLSPVFFFSCLCLKKEIHWLTNAEFITCVGIILETNFKNVAKIFIAHKSMEMPQE